MKNSKTKILGLKIPYLPISGIIGIFLKNPEERILFIFQCLPLGTFHKNLMNKF